MVDHERLEDEARGSTGAPDRDDLSEDLDDDHLVGDYPPDEPLGSSAYGITPGEARFDEPLDERAARHRPEQAAIKEHGQVGRLVQPDEGTGVDDEPDAVARAIDDDDPTAQETATELTSDLSAEEAAMHQLGSS